MCLTLHFNHEPVLYNIITCLLLQCLNYFVEFLDLKLPCACLKQAPPEVYEYCVAYGLKINKIKPVNCHILLSECRLIYRWFQLHLSQITHCRECVSLIKLLSWFFGFRMLNNTILIFLKKFFPYAWFRAVIIHIFLQYSSVSIWWKWQLFL